MSWVMGEMCCSAVQPRRAAEFDKLRGAPFPGTMANMAMQVPPSSNHPGGVNVLMGDASGRFIKTSVDLTTWRALGTRNLRRSHLGRRLLNNENKRAGSAAGHGARLARLSPLLEKPGNEDTTHENSQRTATNRPGRRARHRWPLHRMWRWTCTVHADGRRGTHIP